MPNSCARKFLLLLALLVGVLLVAGMVALALRPASPRLYPVQGKLLYQGKPAAGAVVVFHPVGADLRARRPNAQVGPDGSFSLVTADRAGAAPGEYVITVFWPMDLPPPNPREPLTRLKRGIEATPDRLSGRYAGQTTSALTAQVAGPTNLPLIDLP